MAERKQRHGSRHRVGLAAVGLLTVAGAYAALSLAGGSASAPRDADASAQPGSGRGQAPRAARRLRTITLGAVGDIVFDPIELSTPFDAVRPHLAADVVLGNLEGALTHRGVSKCAKRSKHCFAFHSPPEAAPVLTEAGFTVLNLANNHSYDYGAVGYDDTATAVARAGVRTTGRMGEIAFQRVRGVTVAVVGFAPYPTATSLVDLTAVRALVRKADRRADLVVATMHAGAEGSDATHVRPGIELYAGENRGDVMAFAHAAVDAGADLVAGHGPHVLRGLEWYRARLIAYSLGNFSDSGGRLSRSAPQDVTAILRARIRSDGSWVSGRLVPIRLNADGIPRPDPTGAAVTLVDRLSRQDFGRNGVRLRDNGRIRPLREPSP